MTDARADALTAPTAGPGIVAALVYIGDQIAAMSHQRASNRLLPVDGAEPDQLDTPPHKRHAAGRTAQHPTDRHLLPKEDR